MDIEDKIVQFHKIQLIINKNPTLKNYKQRSNINKINIIFKQN